MLITIDFWDTVLRRRCHPDLVKVKVAHMFLLRQKDSIRAIYRDEWILFRRRQMVEAELARVSRSLGCDDEYRHEAVILRWVESVFIGNPDVIATEVSKLIEYELELEVAVTYPDSVAVGRLAQLVSDGGRIYFLSDFYMSAGRLFQLLEHHNLRGFFCGGVTSADVGLNKRTGRLFAWAKTAWMQQGERHLHIGDNPVSDVEVPRSMAIEAELHLPDEEHQKRLAREEAFRVGSRCAIHEQLTTARRVAWRSGSGEADRAFNAGLEIAPLIIGFALMIAERSAAVKVKSLFFLTREGEFFKRIYDILISGSLWKNSPRAVVLESSRLASFLPSLGSWNLQEMMRLWSQYSVQSPRAFLMSLGVAVEEYVGSFERYGIDIDLEIRYPWMNEAFKNWFSDAEVVVRMEDHIRRRRLLLDQYLLQCGWGREVESVAVVDVGWRGTILDNLALLRPASQVRGYYLGLKKYLNDQGANVEKFAFGPDLNRDGCAVRWSWDFVAPIEMLTNCPGGSVIGYRLDENGRVCATRRIDEVEDAVYHRYIKHFQAGVAASAVQIARAMETHHFASTDFRDSALNIWRDFLEASPRVLADAYFSLNHNEVFGLGRYSDKSRGFSPLAVVRAAGSLKGRRQIACELDEIGWLTGYLRRSSAPVFSRMLVRAYLWYKRGPF